jgi:hypothetical protein
MYLGICCSPPCKVSGKSSDVFIAVYSEENESSRKLQPYMPSS